MPQFPPDAEGVETIGRLRQYVRDEGRSTDEFGIESRISLMDKPPEEWGRELETWRELEATHITVNTMRMGLKSPADHIDMIRRFAEEIGVS
jgi:hypothetical protein